MASSSKPRPPRLGKDDAKAPGEDEGGKNGQGWLRRASATHGLTLLVGHVADDVTVTRVRDAQAAHAEELTAGST